METRWNTAKAKLQSEATLCALLFSRSGFLRHFGHLAPNATPPLTQPCLQVAEYPA